jgi:uncharacterized protein
MKVVIDTNIVLRAIPNNGDCRWVIDIWKKGYFNWVISNEILTEYVEMIGTIFSEKAAEITMRTLLTSENHVRYEPFYHWQLIEKDPDDNKFIDCAIGSGADYLISADNDILKLRNIPELFPPIPIVSINEFYHILFDIQT